MSKNNEWNSQEANEWNRAYETQEAGKAAGKRTKEKKKPGLFKRLLTASLCGIFFVLFALGTVFVIYQIQNAVGLKSAFRLQSNINGKNVVIESQNGQTSVYESDSSAPAAPSDAPQKIDEVDTVVEDKEAFEDTLATTDTGIAIAELPQTTLETVVAYDVADVVEAVMPSIVSINNQYVANYYYFQETEQASGSGIIIGQNDEELLIVTNYHVIANSSTLEVVFCDEQTVQALVKGKDQTRDLAVLAVPISSIPQSTKSQIQIATIGDSDALRVGEPAIAIGNALGYGQSVTTGVISAINREMNVEGVTSKFIQTDAAINPGNSGGALLNISGEVIGINSNKLGGSVVEGMGYAIPISAAMPILEELMLQETRTLVAEDKQSYLGITGANITQQEQLFYGYPEGVYVANVYEDSAAEAGGLEKGDFILSFDGEKVSSMEELQNLLLYYEAGTVVDIVIKRPTNSGYREQTLTVTLGNRSELSN